MTLISKNFSEVITFSRGTGATRVNSVGLIVGVDFSATSNTIATGSKTFTITADANVNRDWPAGSNVIAVSQAGATGSMTGTVTSYTPSTQSLVINVTSVTGSGTSTDWRIGSLDVREDYDPVTLAKKGVLSEVAATNVIIKSDRLNEFFAQNVVVTGNVISSPDGSMTADRIEAATAATAYINRSHIPSAANVNGFTWSVWLKGLVGGETVKLFIDGGLGGATSPLLTLTTQWQRFSVSSSASTPVSGFVYILTGTTYGASGSSMYVWGAQLEASPSATSYIPTTTAQVTRNADNFPLTASAVASIRQGEGTLYAEIDCPDTGVAQKRALRLSGTNADIRIGKQGTGTLSNFTKMAEGAGLRLMGTANSLIRGNGQEMLPVTAIDQRTGTATTTLATNAVAFNGANQFALACNTFASTLAAEEATLDSALTSLSGKGTGAITISGVHYNGNRFLMSSSNAAGVVLVSDGTSYRRINTPVITQPTNEVTSGLVGATLRNVIVGNAGFIATSDDNGETWTARTSGTGTTINAVTRSTTHFIAAVNVNSATLTLRRSTDGETWVAVANAGVAQALFDVHANGATVVGVGTGGLVTVSADNGATWTAATATNTTQLLNGVTYSPTLNLWVAVGNGGTIITATDPASTWTVQTSGTTQNLSEANIFNNAIYIIGSTQTLLTSTNGTSYTSLTAGVAATLAGIAASPTTLLITGSGGAMASSTNGTTFTSRTNNSQTLNGIAFGNDVFVSVGNAANGSGYIATIAADGTVTRRVSGVTANINNVRFLNGMFVAVGASAALISTSSDGVTWTPRLSIGGDTFDVAFGLGTFIAVSALGRYVSSTNGTTWTPTGNGALGTAATFRGIDFANGTFVTVAEGGAISTSTNGTTWTLRTSGTTANLNSVMFSTRDNLWYAAGDGGVLLYSPDAITWTAVQNSGTASILGTTLQSNQPLPQFKSGVNKIALSYRANQVISALNGVASTTDTTATIPSITAGTIGENFNGTIQKIEVLDSALTTSEIIEKTL